jgi:hypothetical protein
MRRDFRSLFRCDLGILVRGTVAGSECPTLVKVMPDVDVLLTENTRAKRLAAAMIDTALRKRFELMVAEFQRDLIRSNRVRFPSGASRKTEAALSRESEHLAAQPVARTDFHQARPLLSAFALTHISRRANAIERVIRTLYEK